MGDNIRADDYRAGLPSRQRAYQSSKPIPAPRAKVVLVSLGSVSLPSRESCCAEGRSAQDGGSSGRGPVGSLQYCKAAKPNPRCDQHLEPLLWQVADRPPLRRLRLGWRRRGCCWRRHALGVLRGGGRDAAHLAVQWPFGRSSCTARAVQEVARSFPDGRGCQGLDLERDGDASWVSVTTPTAAEVGEETGIAEGQATTRRLVPMNNRVPSGAQARGTHNNSTAAYTALAGDAGGWER